jgi:CheY-like chemotaxis protein
MIENDRLLLNHGSLNRFISFHELMRFRIRDILMVSSLYDSFILGEEGGLYELLLSEYMGLNLSHPPDIKRVSSGRDALDFALGDNRFDVILTTLHLEDMHVLEFARSLREAGITKPLVLLTYDSRELGDLTAHHDLSYFDKVFMWQGNFQILLAIIKCIEDLANVEEDTRQVGVQSIILIEDNVKFYSSYLPIIYTQLLRHSQNVIEEGVNLAHKMLRMRARPKILLCENYEQAWKFFQTYHETILGVISDIRFPRKGEIDSAAGIKFARNVKKSHLDIPILLQSNDPEMESVAHEIGASFLLKNSPRLLHKVRKFMKRYFSFDDFVFCLPDGTEVDRAHDLAELQKKIRAIPDESLLYHAERNHFSNWLKARTEFYLAHMLRPRKVSDYASVDHLREALISYLREYHIAQYRGIISDFDPKTLDPESVFTRLGGGSLGGKGRGLAFMDTLLNISGMRDEFEGINISVPPTVILETDVFDDFMEQNDLGDFALSETDDGKIVQRFLEAPLPEKAVNWLQDLVDVITYPLAVRSSSLFEDSQFQPFAGVYETRMLPNNHQDKEVRLADLMAAIKRVYASTFSSHAKGYIKATPYRLEEEKMAVMIQKLIGCHHGDRFYPDFSGVARSHNFYPVKPMKPGDGIVSVALGLGTIVVEGGLTVRFCPKYPRRQVQFSSIEDVIHYSQREFYALKIPEADADYDPLKETLLSHPGLDAAEQDGVLGAMGSTYSAENNAIYDGISRNGLRIVSFAPILKQDYFPLATILERILELGRWGMSSPVEIEFSVNLSVPPGQPREFRLLQLRPMVIRQEQEQLNLDDISESELICNSAQVLGNGCIDNIHDIVLVDMDTFERSRTVEIAREIGLFNLELGEMSLPYLLIGIGRWGSADPWLGIPVTWDEISGARTIVETGFKDMKVAPSQGTHFFQNLNAFQIGYFTVNIDGDEEFIDWKWLLEQPPHKKRSHSRHLRFENPVTIKMNGRKGRGIIIKPMQDSA